MWVVVRVKNDVYKECNADPNRVFIEQMGFHEWSFERTGHRAGVKDQVKPLQYHEGKVP